ncbi:MAG: hypothetical protein Q4G19_08915 [Clostridia bacterium]|nr:hypothetical protein [Clostridia bacterium]
MKRKHIVVMILAAAAAMLLIIVIIPHTHTWNIHSAERQFRLHEQTFTDHLEDTPVICSDLRAVGTCMTSAGINKPVMIQLDGSSFFVYHTAGYGDLYQYSYDYGIIRSDRPDVLSGIDGLTLEPLGEQWYVYCIRRPQF